MINKIFSFSPVQNFKIIGHSMEPTLKDGDKVLVSRLAYLFRFPKTGDIVAAKLDGKVFIKRISKIENKNFFLTGDNSDDSFDSRKFGMITKENIMGKVINI